MKRLVCLATVVCAVLGVLASPATAGTIEGTVTPVKWAQEVEVCFISTEPSESCAVPKADGSYVYPGVKGIVTFEFIPTYRSNLLAQFFDHKGSLAEADYIEVGPNVIKGINADLLEGGSIAGVVTARGGGVPLPEVEVCATSVSPPTLKSCDETDANGGYDLHSLPTGLYKVGFWGQAASAEYDPTYYGGKPSLAQGTPVAVSAGRVTPGIDAALVEGARISGKVFAAGAPLNDIAVCLFADAGATPRRCTDSGEDGSYTFQGLASGSYQVGFSLEASETGGAETGAGADAFESEYYADVPTRAQATTLSLLAPGKAEDIDAHLSGLSIALPLGVAPIPGGPPSTSIALVVEPAPRGGAAKSVGTRPRSQGRFAHRKPMKPGELRKVRRVSRSTQNE